MYYFVMARISSQSIDPKHLEKLGAQFNKITASLNTKNAAGFFDDLLGEEEKLMLSKRLAAIAMLIEGNSSYQIWQLLKISPTTANKIRLGYECGKYDHIEKAFKSNKKDYEQFWTTLDIILRAGMPPMGRGRWKSILNSK